ncbi:MAG: type I DNA topoisomerase [Bacteroidetes bacterium]|nr:type I DNA topoisomerase [Bacteroidota bacterium]
MIKNLVIVESPAKAKTIERFLGSDFQVKSSYGHIRDLSEKELGIDIREGFTPRYVIPAEKKKVVTELKKLAGETEVVWLASDEDREGEAIAWHLTEILELDEARTQRIVFHEITKMAITEAIKNPRKIDQNLVQAQQARRVLDRLVGYELSPLLWKKVKPALSAGRVQSVAVRLVVERENEIRNFRVSSAFRITAKLLAIKDGQPMIIQAELPKRFSTRDEAYRFLEKCKQASFQIDNIETKPAKKSPAPPFTTSTLQQEASRKLGFSVANTMRVAQQLYEDGKITYMRTDSVNLSKFALAQAKEEVVKLFGKEYSKTRQFTTKLKGAQEAHEAIRPTFLENRVIEGDNSKKRLYDLIWKRTIASQMSDAQIEKTSVSISISTTSEKLIASGEVLVFDGFLKVYKESSDDDDQQEAEGILPALSVGEMLKLEEMSATERFTQQPARYTEASLVKKLEELGIGRPSTYAPVISTIQKRGYVVREDRPGYNREYQLLVLTKGEISEEIRNENTGFEKAKLFPTDIGSLVTDFLVTHFSNILDYNFTATVEEEFDEIAMGKRVWNEMIKTFYFPFHEQVENIQKTSKKVSGTRKLGVDPASGKNVYVKIGRFGPMVQIGETESDEKPRFAGVTRGLSIEDISLEQALELFKLPRPLGQFEEKEVIIGTGRFGPFIKLGSDYFSLPRSEDPYSITMERATELILELRDKKNAGILKDFSDPHGIKVIKGRWGPYIAADGKNYRIPKNTEIDTLTPEDCRKIINEQPPVKGKKRK